MFRSVREMGGENSEFATEYFESVELGDLSKSINPKGHFLIDPKSGVCTHGCG